ncbi:hypothetical protein F0562_035222 [Nyssa sinensis]|uniref:Uncharacterized protein n=1 Tax=Nyssa sinensis TaxID=561372 RepID=A0A5J5ACE9_9ASTE|nr:hypothetical protein F0562_035222 [Nyssa sinensis]
MGEPTEIIPSPEPLDLDTIRSRIRELSDIQRSSTDGPELSTLDSEHLLRDYAVQLESKINQIASEFSDISSLSVQDLGKLPLAHAYLEHLKDELNSVEAEKAKFSNEIEDLTRTYAEDSTRLESDIEWLNCSLDYIALQGLDKAKADERVNCSTNGDNQTNLLNAHGDCKFKILELSHQIEKNKITLKSLQDLDCVFKRFEAIEKFEDELTGLKVIEFEGNCIRLSLRTYIPNLESLLSQQKIEGSIEALEQNHELLIEVVDGTMELKNVEIFPNDVYTGEIFDAAKSFRQLSSHLLMLETWSSLEWFVRRVQDRIILCTLRRFVVKCANKSRHSFEYLDRDEIIIAHMLGGVDAFMKVSQGWPLSNSALRLKSLKSSSHYSKEISLSFLCKVEEVANSLDARIRQSLLSFVDAIEDILMQRMRVELQSDNNSGK